MKIEIILALVLVSVFVIDYLLRKKKKPQSTEVLIPDNSKTFKTKYFIRIGFISIIILACVYFYHFFPKKIVEDVDLLISSEKYEEAFKKIDNFKTIYGKTINSDSLENEVHEIRISNYENINYNTGNLDSIRDLEKYYDSYSAFNLSRGYIKSEIFNKYDILNFQHKIAEGLFLYNYIGQKNPSYRGDRTAFKVKQDSIKNVLELKLKNARDFAFDEKNSKFSRFSLQNDANATFIHGDLNSLNKILELGDIDTLEIELIEFLLKILQTQNYFDNEGEERKKYFDFARKSQYKITKRWYAEQVLLDEILAGEMISNDVFTHNVYEAVKSMFGNKKISKKKEKALQKIVSKYAKLNIENYNFSEWTNFYWTKSSVYLDTDKNTSLDALYTIENEVSKLVSNTGSDAPKGVLARVLFRIGNIKSEKDDTKGALESYQRAEKLYDFKGKDLQVGQGSAPDYSEILGKIFMHKWNIKPYGNKNGACEDLKLAGKINADKYYDFYIKMCN